MVMVCVSVQLPEVVVVPEDEVHLASFDFINQIYQIRGATVQVTDNIQSPNITANGLEIAQDALATSIIGDLLALLITGEWVVVIEWVRLAAGTRQAKLLIIDDDDLRDNFIELTVSTLLPGSQNVRATDGDDAAFQEGSRFAGQFVSAPGLTVGGIHRLAVRRVDASIARSLNGSANANNSDASGSGALIVHFSTPLAAAGIGNNHGSSGTTAPFYMRSLDIYNVNSYGEADLPGFSA